MATSGSPAGLAAERGLEPKTPFPMVRMPQIGERSDRPYARQDLIARDGDRPLLAQEQIGPGDQGHPVRRVALADSLGQRYPGLLVDSRQVAEAGGDSASPVVFPHV